MKYLLVLLSLLSGIGVASAQQSLAEIQAAVAATSSELDQVDAMLADVDPNRRLAALQLLIASGNPVYMKRAKEVGLLSSDPEMQRVALAATFDQGGPFRLELDLSNAGEAEGVLRDRIADYNGNVDETRKLGQVTFSTGPYDPAMKCWPFPGDDNCAIIPSGAAYSLNGWRYGAGSLQLQPDGTLLGSFSVNRSGSSRLSAPARVPLAE